MSTMECSIVTFGCQMNKSDSERLATTLEGLGYAINPDTENWQNSQLLIFNTCSVRQHAEDRVFGMMKQASQLKQANPRLLVGITGCMTRVSSTRNSEKRDKLLNQLEDLDIVFRIEDLPKLGGLLKEADPELAMQEVEEGELKNYFKINPRYSNKFQAFVPIMTGCDKFCTYCIVPFTRGREVSRPMMDVVEEVEQLVAEGCLEVTLLGQNVNSYGKSWADKRSGLFGYENPDSPFTQLVRRLDQIEGLERLRFTSPHPQDMTEDVVKAIAECRTMMPYIHLPVQSGNDEVLRRMNRNYTAADYLEIVKMIRQYIPDCAFSTDIIVGFPGETEEQFMDTYKLFEEVQFDMSFTARMSPRRGTAAERLMTDDVTAEEKGRRWHMLNDLLRDISERKHKELIGQELEVLVETYDPETGECTGRDRHFKKVQFPGKEEMVGTLVNVKATDSLMWLVKGVAVVV